MKALLLAVLLLAPPVRAMEKEIVPICKYDQALCEELDAFVSELADLMPAPKKLSAAQVSALNVRFQKDDDLIDAVVFKEKLTDAQAEKLFLPVVNALSNGIYTLSLTVVPVTLADLSKLLSRQEKDLDKLAVEVDEAAQPMAPAVREALAARLGVINAAGTRIWDHLQDASLDIGRMGGPMYDKKDAEGRVRWKRNTTGEIIETSLNPLHVRIARLSRRIQETDRKLGGALAAKSQHAGTLKEGQAGQVKDLLKDPFAARLAGNESGGGAVSVGKTAQAAVPAAIFQPAVAPKPASLLDMRKVPEPPATPQAFKFESGGKVDSESKESKRVKALKKYKLTRTIGDPGGRAALVFQQTGETCAIAAQVMVLEESGAVHRNVKSRKQAEDELYARAAEKDLFLGNSSDPNRRFKGGTAGAHMGALLDMPVTRHFAATKEDLFAAVSKGRMIIVSANTGKLWNNPKYANGGHVVVITGAEVERAGGALLGYYINDTGTNVGGRFITAKQFHDAWQTHGGVFIEPR